jgi:hypothetical protein
MSDYEWMVELAGKAMAERDNHPLPKSVTTPDAFYEVMARAALDAIGLQSLLEESAQAHEELKNADEGPDLAVNADAVTTPPEDPSGCLGQKLNVPPVTRLGYEKSLLVPPSRLEGGTKKARNARLRGK